MDAFWPKAEWVAAHRRAAVVTIVLIVLMLVASRLYFTSFTNAASSWAELVRDVLDGFISTICVSAVVTSFLWWLGPRADRIPPGGELAPADISSALSMAAETTETWEYIGHTGRYFRSSILPALQRRGRTLGAPVMARVVIIDPTSRTSGAAYCSYRRTSRSASLTKEDWTPEKLQIELIATILCILESRYKNPHVNLLLGISTGISVFRYDKSDNVIVVTQEDPQQPAFSYARGSRFYDYYKRECELIWSQSRKIDIAQIPTVDLEKSDTVYFALNQIFGDRFHRIEASIDGAISSALLKQPPYV